MLMKTKQKNEKKKKHLEKSTFVRTTENKIHEKFEQIQKLFEGRVAC